jgi:hypothetical protein
MQRKGCNLSLVDSGSAVGVTCAKPICPALAGWDALNWNFKGLRLPVCRPELTNVTETRAGV